MIKIMMTVSNKSANVEFTLKEFTRLHILVSEKETELDESLDKCDQHEYLEIKQLQAKLEGILAMIKVEEKLRKQQEEADKETKLELERLSKEQKEKEMQWALEDAESNNVRGY
jgi:hypothetical protein